MARILDTFPDPKFDRPGNGQIVLAGGCFWCMEGVFRQVPGIRAVAAGYAGGDAGDAHYGAVCTGETGHAEAVEITYDPAKVTLGQILKIFFWLAHDPVQENRQGYNVGPQYRSAIFYADATQYEVAEKYIAQIDATDIFSDPIATTLEKLDRFYAAEAEHQNFVARRPDVPYVRHVSQPKIDKVKTLFTARPSSKH